MVDPTVARRLKDLNSLMKSISNFSNDQAHLVDCDNAECIEFTIQPNGGPYHGGTFMFQMDLQYYPEEPPVITCVTPVYHPNIDCFEDHGNICLNIIQDDWTNTLTLDDYVQGILFLFYHPNFDDPLCPLFEPCESEKAEYLENIRVSLRGGEVEGVEFVRNLDGSGDAEATDWDDVKTGNTVCSTGDSSPTVATLGGGDFKDIGGTNVICDKLDDEVNQGSGREGNTAGSPDIMRVAGPPCDDMCERGKFTDSKRNWIKVVKTVVFKFFVRSFNKSASL